jgi:hypothetical protein
VKAPYIVTQHAGYGILNLSIIDAVTTLMAQFYGMTASIITISLLMMGSLATPLTHGQEIGEEDTVLTSQ